MGKISQRSSYKNIRTATKSTRFFVNKQANLIAKKKLKNDKAAE